MVEEEADTDMGTDMGMVRGILMIRRNGECRDPKTFISNM